MLIVAKTEDALSAAYILQKKKLEIFPSSNEPALWA